jgi:hypothetical protein
LHASLFVLRLCSQYLVGRSALTRTSKVDELWWLKSTEHTAAALAKSVYILVAPHTVSTTVDWKVCPDIKVVMFSLSASLFFLTACSAEHITILQLLPWGCFGRDGEGGARQKRGPQHVVVPKATIKAASSDDRVCTNGVEVIVLKMVPNPRHAKFVGLGAKRDERYRAVMEGEEAFCRELEAKGYEVCAGYGVCLCVACALTLLPCRLCSLRWTPANTDSTLALPMTRTSPRPTQGASISLTLSTGPSRADALALESGV